MINIESFLRAMLVMHIAGGSLALITGLGAMLSKKGSPLHRTFGKIYFGSMTAVFLGAVALAIGNGKDFLFMVAFFSYYMTVRGYRILSLKNRQTTDSAPILDWFILIISGAFILFLMAWGILALIQGEGMGVVGILLGFIGAGYLVQDVRSLIKPPTEKMHWWFSHIASMGGSYISAATAFVVVNIRLEQHGWILWVLPSVIGGALISRTIRRYKTVYGT
jgi:uncharacterized membrane protein